MISEAIGRRLVRPGTSHRHQHVLRTCNMAEKLHERAVAVQRRLSRHVTLLHLNSTAHTTIESPMKAPLRRQAPNEARIEGPSDSWSITVALGRHNSKRSLQALRTVLRNSSELARHLGSTARDLLCIQNTLIKIHDGEAEDFRLSEAAWYISKFHPLQFEARACNISSTGSR